MQASRLVMNGSTPVIEHQRRGGHAGVLSLEATRVALDVERRYPEDPPHSCRASSTDTNAVRVFLEDERRDGLGERLHAFSGVHASEYRRVGDGFERHGPFSGAHRWRSPTKRCRGHAKGWPFDTGARSPLKEERK